ncbi:hypothetical protein [Pedobacter jeongneungensis]|uniref:hypothetical protein n=1 Tax=Pedobacter jeongneungensis TaxID=947309 RepID=UPI0013B3E60F|nr:hypothetical protein [Pedobacter jeongneungensis]
MEKVKVKRVFGNAEFVGPAKKYGLKLGHRYQIRIAYLVDSGSLQLHLDTQETLFFIDYLTQHAFDKEWIDFKKISKKAYEESSSNY